MYKHALKALCLISLVPALNAHAAPSNEDEASMGAAALIVLAQKCDAARVNYFQTQAAKTLNDMLQLYSAEAKHRVFDNLDMKIKALHISSSADTCLSAKRLHSIAYNWGYEHLVKMLPLDKANVTLR